MVAQILMKQTTTLPIPIITTTLIVEMVMYSNLAHFSLVSLANCSNLHFSAMLC